MSNTLITPTLIAERMLPQLFNNALGSQMVYLDYSNDFVQGVGSTVTVRVPAEFTAIEFDGDLSGQYQNITESSISVAMNTIATTDVVITSQELTQDLDALEARVLIPAARSLMQKLDTDLFTEIYKGSYLTVGAAASTPDALSDFTGVRKELNEQNAPFSDRFLVVNADAEEKFLQLDTLVEADKSGATQALREGSIGRVMGLGTFSSNNIQSHVIGTLDAGALTTGTAGSKTLTIASGGNAGTVKKGDILTITGGISHVATALATMSSGGAGTVYVEPAVPAGNYAGAATALTANHVGNVGFQKEAIALVSRPLAPAMGGAQSASLSYNGLNLRVTWDYDMDTKSNVLSMDMIYGIRILRYNNVIRLLG